MPEILRLTVHCQKDPTRKVIRKWFSTERVNKKVQGAVIASGRKGTGKKGKQAGLVCVLPSWMVHPDDYQEVSMYPGNPTG